MPASENTLPDTIALFPLEGVLLLPRGHLPLNIFEPRYLRMVDDALATRHRLIGMIQPRETGALFDTGCAGRITSFHETEDGRYRITLTGVSRFAVKGCMDAGTPYRMADVKWCAFQGDGEKTVCAGIDRDLLMNNLRRYFMQNGLAADWDVMAKTGDETLITALAMICPFTPAEKQALLEAPCCKTRAALLMTLLDMTASPAGFDNDGATRQH